jgi:hypothetical protein
MVRVFLVLKFLGTSQDLHLVATAAVTMRIHMAHKIDAVMSEEPDGMD